MAITFQIFMMIASIFLYMVIGARVYSLLCSLVGIKTNEADNPSNCVCFIFGLLIHLVLILLLKCCQIPWWLAFFLPLVPACFWIKSFSFKCPNFTPNFVLWFFVVLSLGITSFHFINNQIETPWANNYGDLTFHFGMIASFVKGDLFPPVFHLYAGESLSYPFMINLWSSAYWWMNQSFDSLHLIFIFQWTILWCIVFFALNGNKYRILPWTVLLGGGTYDVINSFSWKLITESKPWSVFLPTVWITQRAALFGTAVMLIILYLVYDAIASLKQEDKNKFLGFSILAGCILGLFPLVHVHFCLIAGIFCTLVFFGLIVFPLVKNLFKNYIQFYKTNNVNAWHIPLCIAVWMVPILSLLIIQHVGGSLQNTGSIFSLVRDTSILPDSQGAILNTLKILVTFFSLALLLINVFVFINEGKDWCKCFISLVNTSIKSDLLLRLKCKGFLFFCVASLLGVLFSPWLLGKSSIVRIIYGWPPIQSEDVKLWEGISHSLNIWLASAFSLFITFLTFVLASKKFWENFILAVLFVVANIILLAYWDWDQIKVFIAIYVIYIFLWSRCEGKVIYPLHYLLIILCIPALIECWRILSLESMTTPFPRNIILEAKVIENNTPQDAIIVSAPEHNSPVLLSGRRMFLGYAGTLWSHGIKYKDREWMVKNMSLLCNCEKNTSLKGQENCPDYILWNENARKFWANQSLCQNARHIVGNLYKLK